MGSSKRIPVSEETWKSLGSEKEPGQTWDDLLQELHREARKEKIASKVRKAKKGELETVSLDDI